MTKMTPEKKAIFLQVLADGGSVSQACGRINVSRNCMYVSRKHDADLAADWDDAIEQGTDCLEDEAVRRAKTTSDTLLIFMLKARRPDKFKDRSATELTGKDGAPLAPPNLVVRLLPMQAKLTDEST